MNLTSTQILRRLGEGESIASLCAAAGISRLAFDAWWKQEAAARVPSLNGNRHGGVRQGVRIRRDQWGIPDIQADNDEDLFFGFGYAMAQDRLFQLDFLRRKGAGRLSEILGADGRELDYLWRLSGLRNILEWDVLARTIGFRRIAECEWTELSQETRLLLQAFSGGINAVIDDSRERPPIEFDLLAYQPEPWSPIDCLTIEGEFRWYLTGRFPVIVVPELARRILGDGPLYHAFLQVESDAESILPPESYPRGCLPSPPTPLPLSTGGEGSKRLPFLREGGEGSNRLPSPPVLRGRGVGGEGDGGSNNWVVSGRRSVSDKPLLANDPHIPFEAVSWWYEVRLRGGSFDVTGAAYAGMPAVMLGRNQSVAWGFTNNICSQRDLYQEKVDPQHPDCFLYDGQWEPARKVEEIISVKGGAAVYKTIRSSRNGPIVDEVLPQAARRTGPVSLKWLGAHRGGCLTALLNMDRAKSAHEFHEAMRPWHVPTFAVVYADTVGHIGFHSAGSVPIRNIWERGYRPGWDPRHQWDGLIPFEGMPQLTDPERGWLATANNRPAPENFPYPLSGTWSHGLRAERIRHMIEAKARFTREDFIVMQQDALSLRAQRCVPNLLAVLSANPLPRVAEAIHYLREWDYRMETDRVAATIFEIFFDCWTQAVVRQRFEAETAELLSGGASGLAAALLAEDNSGWFPPGTREQTIVTAMETALDRITQRLGSDISQWTWGRYHTLPLRHFLSGRGDLAALLDRGNCPIKGDYTTVCNAWVNADGEARMGATYRLIADLSDASAGMWAIDAQSQSGHPGSPHYRDQLDDWIAGRYHYLSLADDESEQSAASTFTLEPERTGF